MEKISIIGLGKLGLPLMAAMADRGFQVIGYDNDAQKVYRARKGEFHYEHGLAELIQKNTQRLLFTDDIRKIQSTNISFVVVPTPSMKNGSFSITYLKQSLSSIARILKNKKDYHLIVVVSTVLPGSMEKLKGVLEKASEKKCGRDFGLCYNPAFIALGNVIHNFLHPDFVLIGESDAKSGLTLEKFYNYFCKNQAKIHRMNFVNAELTKISVNTFITMKISFGNILARLCEKLPGAHSDIVTQAIGSDRRIGTHYLKGALGYGGPCFPRDNRAFSYVAKNLGFQAFSAEATDRVNRSQIQWFGQMVLALAKRKDRIAILGLSYKQDTDVIEESQGVALARFLLKKRRKLILFDPASMGAARKLFGDRVYFGKSLSDSLASADTIVITTPWKNFSEFKPEDLLSSNGHPKKIIDPWRLLEDQSHLLRGVGYIPLGLNLSGISEDSVL